MGFWFGLKMEMFSNEPQTSEGKRHNFLMATKAGENASKKPRVESRSSCPPFKVITFVLKKIHAINYKCFFWRN